jgi:hypothetical protein
LPPFCLQVHHIGPFFHEAVVLDVPFPLADTSLLDAAEQKNHQADAKDATNRGVDGDLGAGSQIGPFLGQGFVLGVECVGDG